MKKTLFIISAFVLCHTSFGQNNSVLNGFEPFQHSKEFFKDYNFFIPKENLEKNNSYDGPMSIDEYTVTAGVTSLIYTHECTYSPAGVLVSITKYDNGMNALQRSIYGRDINGKVTSIVYQTDVAGSLEFDRRATFEYVQGHLKNQLDEEYNLGTNEWEFDFELTLDYIGGYDYPSEIIFTSIYSPTNVQVSKIQYQYDSENNPTYLAIMNYSEDFLSWIPNQEWIINEWGPTTFKPDFIFQNNTAPMANTTDFIIGKGDQYALYPSNVVLKSYYDQLTETYNSKQYINGSVYDSENNRTQFYIDEITPTDTVPVNRLDGEVDPCYGFNKALQYDYTGGSFVLSSGGEFVGETTPYLSSCYVNAYNRYGSFNSGNPTGTWNRRYEINHVGNLSVDETEASLFEVYPNPTSDNVTIQSVHSGNAQLKITDLMGKTMLEKELNGNTNVLSLNELPTGIYIIEFQSNGLVETSRFVKN